MHSLRALALGCGLMSAGVAAAAGPCPTLAAARDAYERFDFPSATRAAEACLAAENVSRETLIEIYEMLGIMAASRRQTDAAYDAFIHMFKLDPKHALADVSPRIATPYYQAQSKVASDGALALQRSSGAAEGSTVTLSFALTGNTPGLAEIVRLHARADGGTWSTQDAPVAAAQFSIAAQKLEWWAELLGKRSAQLFVLGSQASPQLEAPAPPPAVAVARGSAAPEQGASLRPAAWVTAGAGVVALAAGAVLGVMSRSAWSSFESATVGPDMVVMGMTRAQAVDLQSRGTSEAIAADVLFIAGAVLACGGVALWLLDGGLGKMLALVPAGPGLAIVGTFW